MRRFQIINEENGVVFLTDLKTEKVIEISSSYKDAFESEELCQLQTEITEICAKN